MTNTAVAIAATPVIVDEGSSQIKAVWCQDGELKHLIIKSRGSHTLESTLDGGVGDNVYAVDDTEINIGDNVINPIATNSDLYQTSGINRALVHHALRKAGFAGQSVDLMVTLPVDTFFQSPAKRDAKKAHMRKPVTHVNGQPMAVISQILVAPEAVPVLDSIRLDDQGQLLPDYAHIKRILAVDIGGTTTDITVITSDNTSEGHASVKIGVFDIAKNLRGLLFNDPTIEARDPSMDTLDHTLRTRTFRGQDVSHHVKAACEGVRNMIHSAMMSLMADPYEVDFICYVGGGAHLLQEPLSLAYGGTTHSHSHPELAVAIGLMKNELSHAE